MKKFLSLVLALVMTMSLVTISAGAKDYTDAADINYAEAVDVMSELKVIDGYADGSFNPDATLTRGAAAKIICNLILGPTTAAALKADSAVFPDVPADHTFAGYIAYCAQQGIISGYADGTFKPANGLTGYAFMKMLLGALGYDQNTEGYVGANYSVQVAKQALAIGLDDGNDNFDGTKIVTREEALLYAFNTLKANMVEYTAKTEVTTGNSVVTISGGRREVENKKTDYTPKDANDDVMQFVEKYFAKVTVESSTDAFGRWTNKWEKNGKKIGEYVKTPAALYHADVNQKTVYADLDLEGNGTDFTVMIDGKENVADADFTATKKGTAKLSTAKVDGDKQIIGNGSDIYVYYNEDTGAADIVVINTFLAKVADDYDEKDEELDITVINTDDTIAGVKYTNWDGETLLSDDWADLDEYAKDDYVLVTIADGVVKSLKKAEPVSATVTEYVHSETVTAGGDEYKYSAASLHTEDDGDDYKFNLKEAYDLYLDEEGNVLYAKGAKATDKYVYVEEFSAHSTSKRAAVDAYSYFLDGTVAEIKVTKIGDVDVTAADFTAEQPEATYNAGWYTYTVKNDKYTLTWVDDQIANNPGADTVVTNYKDQHTLINMGTVAPAARMAEPVKVEFDGNSKTTFLVVDKDGEVKVYTGIRNVPEIKAAADTEISTHFKSVYAQNVIIFLGAGKAGSADASDDVIFLLELGKQGNDTDDDEYYKYTALKNGEKTTIKVDKQVFIDNDEFVTADALLLDVIYTGKNYVSGAYIVEADPDLVKLERDDVTYDTLGSNEVEYEGDVLEFAGADSGETDYFMAESYKIYVIDGKDYDVYNMYQLNREAAKYDADIAEGVDPADAKGINLTGAEIYGILNADNEDTALYIDLA